MQSVCCYQFGSPDALERVDVDTPKPGSGEVLVEITAAGVGFVDGLMVQGLYPVSYTHLTLPTNREV